jgi:metal-sulfur cluster biosynthetic enzyme
MAAPDELETRVRTELSEVLDPCSVGRQVPAGLTDMGMVCSVECRPREDSQSHVRVELRLTSPGCSFQMYFDQQVSARLEQLAGVGSVEVVWSREFDWSDDDMSPELKGRLRHKRELMLHGRRAGVGSG